LYEQGGGGGGGGGSSQTNNSRMGIQFSITNVKPFGVGFNIKLKLLIMLTTSIEP
jgi:hypothetical protein